MSDLDIKKIRENLGITQEQLAEMVGVHPRTVQNWESGSTIPKSKHTILRDLVLKPQRYAGDDEIMKERDNGIGLRIKELVNYLGVKQSEFAHMIGVETSNLNSILNGKRNAGPGMVDKIILSLDNISRDWLLFGKGEMLKSSSPRVIVHGGNNSGIIGMYNRGSVYNNAPAKDEHQQNGEAMHEEDIPILPPELYKEPNIDLWKYTEVNKVYTSPVVRQFSSFNRFFRVTNSSMAPRVLASDIVALQRVSLEDIVPGHVYMIDHHTLGALLRKVKYDGNGLLLVSNNREEYPDFLVKKEDVYSISRVVGLIRTDV